MTTQPLRALVGARVSVMRDGKVSPQAQIATATRWVDAHGYTIVGQFEDLGVSASVPPEERKDLGPWLAEDKVHEWDAIVWSKLDRAFRRIKHCSKFIEWAENHQKVVVFAEDGLLLDYRPSQDRASIEAILSQVFMTIAAAFAEIELNRLRSRALDGQRVIRQTTRWAGGTAPIGFRPCPHPSGEGRGLETDPEGRETLYRMAGWLLDGWSFNRIAVELGSPWTGTNVQLALTHPRTQGLKTHRKQPVLDAAHNPIRLADPTFDPDTWRQIQQAVTARKLNRRQPTDSSNPMLGVGLCGVCGASLAQQVKRATLPDGTAREYRYYRCSRAPVSCKRVNIRAETAEEQMAETFLNRWGETKVTRRVFVPGEDHAPELEEVRGTIARLRRESDAGLVISADDETVYLARMAALIRRRTNLEAMPSKAAGWTTEETDQTYREVWAASDHRQLLVDKGVKFVLHPSPGGKAILYDLYDPEDGQALPIRIGDG